MDYPAKSMVLGRGNMFNVNQFTLKTNKERFQVMLGGEHKA